MAPRTPKDPAPKPARPAKAAKAARPDPVTEVPETPASPVAEADAASAGAGNLKLKDLVDQVAAATGGKKAEIKPVIEATLSVIGTALATGKALAIPPLGKLRVVKNKGPALTLKLRLADGAKAAGLALADNEEDG